MNINIYIYIIEYKILYLSIDLQVVRNLISNALKFTPRGGTVSVNVSVRPQQWQGTVLGMTGGMTSGSRHQADLGGAAPSRTSSVTLPVVHQPAIGSGAMLSIVVTDTGHGIAKVNLR